METTISNRSRNLSMDWAIGQRDTLSPPSTVGGLPTLRRTLKDYVRTAGGCDGKCALYVGGKKVLSADGGLSVGSRSAIAHLLSTLEEGYPVSVTLED